MNFTLKPAETLAVGDQIFIGSLAHVETVTAVRADAVWTWITVQTETYGVRPGFMVLVLLVPPC